MQVQFQPGTQIKSYYSNGNFNCNLQVIAADEKFVYYAPAVAVGIEEVKPVTKPVKEAENLIESRSWIIA